MKRKLILFALILCLVLPACIMFTACKKDESEINEESASAVLIEIVAEDKTYDGQAVSATATADNEADVTIEYKLASADDSAYSQDAPVHAGTYVVRATTQAQNGYQAGLATKQVVIAPKAVTLAWTAPVNLTYNKETKVPSVAISDGVVAGDECHVSGTLKAGDNNINAGTFAFVASLDNSNYAISANAEQSYTIQKATYSTVRQHYKLQGEEDWRDNNTWFNVLQTVIFGVYCDGGEEIEGDVTYNIYQANSTGNASIDGDAVTGTKHGLVYITATIAESANYNLAYSNGMQGINFQPLEPVEGEQYTVPTNLTATYGSTLGSIELPAGFGWYYDTSSLVGDVGERQWAVVFYPNGEAANIYSTKYNIPVIVTVTKATPVFVSPENIKIPYGTWLAGATGLPAGYYWSGSHDAGEIGEHTWAGTYNPDINNYNTVNGDITYTVVKANPTYKTPTGLEATYGQTLNDVTLPAGFAWAYDNWLSVAVGDPGENYFYVNYTPDDTTHYNVVENIDVIITVSKAVNRVLVQVSSVTEGTTVDTNSLGIDILHGQNTAVIEYKVAGANDDTYSTTAPTEIGHYVVKITVAEDAYFLGVEKTAEFSIIAA